MADKEMNMQPEEKVDELYTIMLDDYDKCLYIGSSSVIGRRNEQQDAVRIDSYYSYLERGRAIAVLCDGMGGLSGGERASALCSTIVHESFRECGADVPIPAFYKAIVNRADDEVRGMKAEDGTPITGSGTTLVSVVVDGGDLYWASVGDSRIYIIRNGEIVRITTDHNYMMLLNEQVKRGEITREAADADPKKEALVSYIGIGGIRYLDINNKPFKLLDGDSVVLCSDGLYRSLSDEEIMQVVTINGRDTERAAEDLTTLAMSKNHRFQDNTSVVVINYQDSG